MLYNLLLIAIDKWTHDLPQELLSIAASLSVGLLAAALADRTAVHRHDTDTKAKEAAILALAQMMANLIAVFVSSAIGISSTWLLFLLGCTFAVLPARNAAIALRAAASDADVRRVRLRRLVDDDHVELDELRRFESSKKSFVVWYLWYLIKSTLKGNDHARVSYAVYAIATLICLFPSWVAVLAGQIGIASPRISKDAWTFLAAALEVGHPRGGFGLEAQVFLIEFLQKVVEEEQGINDGEPLGDAGNAGDDEALPQ